MRLEALAAVPAAGAQLADRCPLLSTRAQQGAGHDAGSGGGGLGWRLRAGWVVGGWWRGLCVPSFSLHNPPCQHAFTPHAYPALLQARPTSRSAAPAASRACRLWGHTTRCCACPSPTHWRCRQAQGGREAGCKGCEQGTRRSAAGFSRSPAGTQSVCDQPHLFIRPLSTVLPRSRARRPMGPRGAHWRRRPRRVPSGGALCLLCWLLCLMCLMCPRRCAACACRRRCGGCSCRRSERTLAPPPPPHALHRWDGRATSSAMPRPSTAP